MNNTSRVTPKDFFLWLGAVATLYGSVISFITLLFGYINHAFPDPLEVQYGYTDEYTLSIRISIATLLVLVPIAIAVFRLIRRDIMRDAAKADLWIRRWALYLTLFIAGVVVAIDLITLINTFLNGDLTTRFMLKVSVILLVAGAAFLHFLADLRGYWAMNPSRSKMVGGAVGVLVLLSIVSGFFIIGSPQQARLTRFDAQKVTDLQNLQSSITYYYQSKQKLPESLADIDDPLTYTAVPVDPQTGASYVYAIVTQPYTFKLCATFNQPSASVYSPETKPLAAGRDPLDMWDHAAGEVCFERTIDPDKFPPLSKEMMR